MSTQERNVHLEYDGTHYYRVANVPSWSILKHRDTELVIGNDNWVIHEQAIALDGFIIRRTAYRVVGYEKKQNLPAWLAQLVHDLPDRLDDEESTVAASEAVGLELDDDGYVIPTNPYQAVKETYTEDTFVTGEWVEATGKPRENVPFRWSATFPSAVKNFPEVHHLFECRLVWDQGLKQMINTELCHEMGKYGQVFTHDDISVYVKDDNDKTIAAFHVQYPRLVAPDLVGLHDAWNTWYENLKQRIRSHRNHAANKCPMCDGTGVAPYVGLQEIIDAADNADALARALYTQKKSGEVAQLRQAIKKLQTIAQQVVVTSTQESSTHEHQ